MSLPACRSLLRPEFLALLALGLLFTGLGVSTVQRAAFMSVERSDFPVYQAAGRAVLEGTSLYEAQSARGWLYMYLPIFAVLMVPLAMLPKALAAGVWYLISLGMLLDAARRSARLAERYVGPSRWGEFWTFVGALVLTGWPWMSGLARGQASVMLAWLTIVAIDGFMREQASLPKIGGVRRWAGAFALSLASAIRVFPALLGIWLLIERRWRALAASLVAGVALIVVIPGLVLGPEKNMELIYEWVTTIALPAGEVSRKQEERYAQMIDPRIFKNQSVQAVAIRWLSPGAEPAGEALARQVAAAVCGALAIVTVLACWLGRRGAGQGARGSLTGAAALVMLSLFLAPVSWVHNYSMAVLPVAILLVRAFAAGGAVSRGHLAALCVWLVGALLCFDRGGYYAGGFLLGGLALWMALVADLIAGARRPPAAIPLTHEPIAAAA